MTIDEKIPLKDLTTFHVGGEARYFCAVKSIEDLKEAFIFASEKNVPIFILGGGSNILISDFGFKGLVIKIANRGIDYEEHEKFVKVKVSAGEHWDLFVGEIVEKGLWGLENLSGIPGTVGGAPVQNIGAYGADVSSVIEEVEVFDPETMDTRRLSNEQCRFRYRSSLFKREEGRSYVIVSVIFKLFKEGSPNINYRDLKEYFGKTDSPKPDLLSIRKAVLEIRGKKFPPIEKIGSAGSFFKNPIVKEEIYEGLAKKFPDMPSFPAGKGMVKLPLAWILDRVCGLKGKKEGNVGLYEKQPIVLVNFGKATAKEIFSFAEEIKKIVKERIGVEIEWEVNQIVEK